MKRILFVDDEKNVLDGLQNLLRKQRRKWDMAFALSVDDALALLEQNPFDVVVSDMRMPNMDGATLLGRVKELYPGTARIILSGQSEPEAVVRAIPVSHQFLSKPCDADTLRIVVERACDLQALLRDEAIQAVVGKLDRLPSVPEVYWELMRALARPETGAAEIAEIVEQDPAMCIKLLQLVNSAYFGLAQQMSSIHQAVSYLGTELVRALTLTAHVFSANDLPPVEGFSLQRLQQGSLLTAKLAKAFLPDPVRAREAFTAGLVHDVGKLVLVQGLQERYAEVLRNANETGRPLQVVESELLGVTHATIGAYLLGVWGLQLSTMEAVAYHHDPGRVGEGPWDILAAVHVADALADNACAPTGESDGDNLIDQAFLERVGLGPAVPRWRAIAEQQLDGVRK